MKNPLIILLLVVSSLVFSQDRDVEFSFPINVSGDRSGDEIKIGTWKHIDWILSSECADYINRRDGMNYSDFKTDDYPKNKEIVLDK